MLFKRLLKLIQQTEILINLKRIVNLNFTKYLHIVGQ